MNCSPFIAIALLLIALTGGALLLYKTQKESLSAFFRLLAWFVIVVSILAMMCCAMRCIKHCCRAKQECTENNECGMERGMCPHQEMNKHIVTCRHADGECNAGCSERKACCKGEREEWEENEGKESSCKEKMKTEVNKDTVVSKKK